MPAKASGGSVLIVGIDPGVKTGLAVWCKASKCLVQVDTMGITAAMQCVKELNENGTLHSIVFEDARLRTGWFGERSAAKQQGAGSIKRDCSIWTEFCEGLVGVPFLPVSPKTKGAKVDAPRFAKLTGWTERTSEHARDAAMLVFGR